MNPRSIRILVLLSVFMVIKYVIMGILALQKRVIFQHNTEMVMVTAFIAGGRRKNSQWICWQKERYRGFLEPTLLGSYSELDF
jgi:hypothetical protein